MPARTHDSTDQEEARFNGGDAAAIPALLATARDEIADGRHWFDAVLDLIAAWTVPCEVVDGREYRYLIGGEAFDWLLLAERVTAALTDVIPAEEREAMLFTGRPPHEMNEDDFRARMGQRKYRAHLNYFYGVTIEEALQLAVEEEVGKDHRAYVWADGEEGVFARIYGKSRADLYARFCEERGHTVGESIVLAQLKEFTYWLFKFRVHWCEPAKIASDTRKGLAQLARMELARRSRPHGTESTPQEFIEVS